MGPSPSQHPDRAEKRAKISGAAWVGLLLLLVSALVVGWQARGLRPAAQADPPGARSVAVTPQNEPTPENPAGSALPAGETLTSTNQVSGSVAGTVSNTLSITVTDSLTDDLTDDLTAANPGDTTQGETEEEDRAEVDPNPLHHTTNILLLGSDRRPKDVNWRTDVIMIMALDLEKGEAGVISIPRDLYIDEIENHLPNKINVVDYLGEQDNPDGGGPALLAQILADRMDLPIHHFLRFEFEGFKEVVNALGGVEIQVDCPIYDFLEEEDIAINLGPGLHTLTGAQALSYVRTRRQGGDLERARRQQRMALAIRDQIRNDNLLPRIPALYVALRHAVKTDIGLVDAIRYTRFGLQLTEDEVHGMILSPPDTMISGWRRGMFVFVPNWPIISETIQLIFDRPPLVETNTVGPAGDVRSCR